MSESKYRCIECVLGVFDEADKEFHCKSAYESGGEICRGKFKYAERTKGDFNIEMHEE